MEQETASIMKDTEHNAATTRGKGELRSQRKVHENDNIEKQTENMGKGSDRGDMDIEWMDTELTQQDMEGVQDDVRLSPSRTKKMDVD
jgi:hypothetical protein